MCRDKIGHTLQFMENNTAGEEERRMNALYRYWPEAIVPPNYSCCANLTWLVRTLGMGTNWGS